jgi:CRP-like cAMP-binding protein
MHSHETRDTLKQYHLFSRLSDEHLDRVCHHAHIISLAEGKSLFCQGDDVVCFYLVLTGKIKLFRVSPDGNEKIVEFVDQGDSFAEALMFMDRPHYPVNATALTSCKIIGINSQDFKAMLRDSIDTCFLLMGSMSIRLRRLIQEIDTLSLSTGTVRIVTYLLQNSPNGIENFDLEIAKSVIASRLSVKPETFSRILKHLHDLDILTINGRNVTIHDRNAMISISSG